MNIHDKSKKEWYDAYTEMAKENALLAAKVRIGEKGRLENLQETVKSQSETFEFIMSTLSNDGHICPGDLGMRESFGGICQDDSNCKRCWSDATGVKYD